MVRIHKATTKDIPALAEFLTEMNTELQELNCNAEIIRKSISQSFEDNVHWFLFYDDNEQAFGSCYCQSVYNHWRLEKRYYLGGFYIRPSHRGQGYFRTAMQQLQKWAVQHNGVQIYAHIHKENKKSLESFASIGLTETDYLICVHHWGE